VEETGVPGENNDRPQIIDVVSSTPDRLAFERLGNDYHKFRNDTKAMEAFIKFHTVRHVYTYEELHVNELSLYTHITKTNYRYCHILASQKLTTGIVIYSHHKN
jgi:hypothetical protein